MVVQLTDKELKVITLRYQGLKNNQIAKKLEVSESDVSQTLSRAVNKIVTVRDTLELMQRIGIIKRDMEIELTESGKALLDKWRHTLPTRIEKLKPVSITSETPLEKVTFVRTERVGYLPGGIVIDENISRTLKEMTEQLNVLTREVSGVRYEFREAMQENEAKRLTRKSYEKYIT